MDINECNRFTPVIGDNTSAHIAGLCHQRRLVDTNDRAVGDRLWVVLGFNEECEVILKATIHRVLLRGDLRGTLGFVLIACVTFDLVVSFGPRDFETLVHRLAVLAIERGSEADVTMYVIGFA